MRDGADGWVGWGKRGLERGIASLGSPSVLWHLLEPGVVGGLCASSASCQYAVLCLFDS